MAQSPDNSIVIAPNQALTDSKGMSWWISDSGQVVSSATPNVNGVVDQLTSGVDALAVLGGNIWQQAGGLWWEKTGQGYDGWGTPGQPDGHVPNPPITPSPSGSILAAPGNTSIVFPPGYTTLKALVDNSGNLWWIGNGQVIENGKPDAGTSDVTEMAIKNGVIYQQGTGGEWWAKTNQGYDGWGTPGNADGHVNSPVAEQRTWIGGGNNDATDAADWSPSGTPQPSDQLLMKAPVMNIVGDALANDDLTAGGTEGSPYAGAPITLNVSSDTTPAHGMAHFSLTDGDPGQTGSGLTTVNLAANTVWVGTINVGPYGQPTVIQGAGQFDNDGTSNVNNVVTINAETMGTGTFITEQAHSQGTKLEFMHGVSAGQTLDITGAEYGVLPSKVQVDDLANFHATTNLGFGELILAGVHADSYSYQNSMLSLFNGKTAIATLNVAEATTGTGAPASNFGVSQVGGSVIVHADGQAYNSGGTLLPLHT